MTTNYTGLNNENPGTISFCGVTPGLMFSWDAAGRNTGRVDVGGNWPLAYGGQTFLMIV